jgi:D-alanyl-lipoteichoic acid acyltransferase DltB (MBOAT superfamily)
MLWGLFKKVAVADQCAPLVDAIFADHANASGSTLVVGAVLFTFQIYGDFSGYSDIAIGCARLFGFDLMRNFAYPFFSRDISEFWRRWHISLNTWFRDYLYIPLGGSRGGMASKVRNTFIIFLVSGFWHGANWTFVIWGGLNALYFIPLMLSDRNRVHLGTVAAGRLLPNLREIIGMSMTFALTVFAFIFFRSDNVTRSFSFIKGMFSSSLWSLPEHLGPIVLVMLSIMLVGEWVHRNKTHGLEIGYLPRPARWAIYLPLTFLVISMSGERVSFIYFQF